MKKISWFDVIMLGLVLRAKDPEDSSMRLSARLMEILYSSNATDRTDPNYNFTDHMLVEEVGTILEG